MAPYVEILKSNLVLARDFCGSMCKVFESNFGVGKRLLWLRM